MKALSYIYGTGFDISVGAEVYFGEIWDGYGNGDEILEGGTVCFEDGENNWEECTVCFSIVEDSPNDILRTLVRITAIC